MSAAQVPWKVMKILQESSRVPFKILYLVYSSEGVFHEFSNSTSKIKKSFNIYHVKRCTEIDSILDVQMDQMSKVFTFANLVSTCRDLINGVLLISNLVKVLVCLLSYKGPLMGNTTKIRLKMSCHNKVSIKDWN